MKRRLLHCFAGLDRLLLMLCLTASAYGLALLCTAAHGFSSGTYLRTQGIAVLLGVFLYLAVSVTDPRRIARLYPLLLLLELVLLGTLLFWGVGESNRSWIRFGGIGIQPAELGKPLFILSFSGHLTAERERGRGPGHVLGLLLHAALVCLSVMAFSRDDGMTLVYLFLALMMAFAAGLRAGVLSAGAVLCIGALPALWTFLLDGYQRTRILAVLEPERYPVTSYQAMQTTHAIASGGLTGKGFLQGTYTQSGLIPTRHTDSIIAVAGEELGLAGCLAAVLLLALLAARCISAALRAGDRCSALIAGGVGGMIIFQTVLNLGMNLARLPVIGLTLPFFSYGGSSVVTMYAAMGLVSAVRRRTRLERKYENTE